MDKFTCPKFQFKSMPANITIRGLPCHICTQGTSENIIKSSCKNNNENWMETSDLDYTICNKNTSQQYKLYNDNGTLKCDPL